MKKVLVTGAALLIAGSMVSAASAEINLSGDARVRYVGTSDYSRNLTALPDGTFQEDKNGASDEFNSRIRVKLDGKAAGGAFIKVRMRFDDFTWDGQGWDAHTNTKNVWADYAYIGVPMGPVTFTGGRMPADFSKFFSYDNRPTRVKLDWKADNVRLIGFIDVKDENVNVVDDWNDNDFMAYGLVGSVQVNDDWSVKAYARYDDDQREFDSDTLQPLTGDKSGFLGSIHTQGKAGTVGLEAEIAYKDKDVQGTVDDGWGWYVDASMDMGAFQPSVIVGGTSNGYMADDDFGFIMIGAAEPITVVSQVGTDRGDSIFAAFVARYAVSDQFKLAGNIVYYDLDLDTAETAPDLAMYSDAWELSGSASYVISEGADLTYKLGYLSPSYDGRLDAAGISDDGYFGHYLRMAIKF